MAGEGAVYRRSQDGKWVAQLSVGGRRTRAYRRRIRDTKREAMAALHDLRAEQKAGVQPSRETVGAFLVRWVASVRNIRPSTRHGYEAVVRYHLLPTIGDVPLASLTPVHVETMLARLSPTLSAKSLRNVHAVLRRALGAAKRSGLVSRNVAASEYVDTPRVTVEEPRALTGAEVERLLATAVGDPVECAVRLAVGTGMRQGELLGLAWEDVDLERGRLHVRRELVRRDGRYFREELKTDRSRRTVPLAPSLVKCLVEHRDRLIEAGFVPTATGPVFPNRRGGPLNGSWLTHRFYALLKRAGIERLPFKNLRTTFSSRLYEAGVPDRTIADLLGHTRTKTMHGHYIATSQEAQQRAIQEIERLVG